MIDPAAAGPPVRLSYPEGAALFTTIGLLGYLRPFLRRERSVTAAAAMLGVDANRVLHRVRRLEKLGLLRVSRLEPRAGRPIKHYRAVADEFFVPHEAVSDRTLEEVMLAIDEGLRHLFYESYAAVLRGEVAFEGWGWRVFGGEDERLIVEFAAGPGEPLDTLADHSPALVDHWGMLALSFPEAKALKGELEALWRRYRTGSGGSMYLVRLGLTPMARVPLKGDG